MYIRFGSVYGAFSTRYTVSKFRTCRRCGERTWDYDAESGEWFCGECDEWADL